MAKPIVRAKKEELLPYILRKINQIGQEVKNESKDYPQMKELLKREVAQRVANWCLALLLTVSGLCSASVALAGAQEITTATADTAQLRHEAGDETSTEVDAISPYRYAVAVDHPGSPALPFEELPWAQIGGLLVAAWELIARLKPTGKDWSLISRLAGIIEALIPNNASQQALMRDVEREADLREDARSMDNVDTKVKGKWIGGKLWKRLVKTSEPFVQD